MGGNRASEDAAYSNHQPEQKDDHVASRPGQLRSVTKSPTLAESNRKSRKAHIEDIADETRTSSQQETPSVESRKDSRQGFVPHNEVDLLGRLWRTALLYLLLLTFDQVNALRLTRALELFLPYMTWHEAYALAQVIEAMDRGDMGELRFTLTHAFMNRNVSRILVQNVRLRWDFLWHWYTMITWNRLFDAWGQLPLVGITSFPATENFPSTRNHALASMFRVLLGPGNWLTRVVTRGREGLVTDNPEIKAQNLSSESNGFELANRNQFGTYFGRQKLNEFRCAHRLPTDESIVRTFVTQPMPTLVNNGVVHVLRRLSNHWHGLLNQPCGSFAHQRMEQLDPFETLRVHVPVVLLVLSSLRGRTEWDSRVMGPIIKRLQALRPSPTAEKARELVRELQETIIIPVCAGIPSFINPFQSWADAIERACIMVEEEASKVYELVSSVETGIRLGYDLFRQVTSKVPSDGRLRKMIIDHIDGKYLPEKTALRVRSALQMTTPRDKRTLIELVKQNLAETNPAKLLLGRVKTLLQRELRREMLNQRIREMSMGAAKSVLVHGEWYWLEEKASKPSVCEYDRDGSNDTFRRFVHVNSGKDKYISRLNSNVKTSSYVAVGETISRAQKAFMTIELEYGTRFAYNGFMEFSHLRKLLHRLIVVSQLSCEELDNARLNILKDTQRNCQMKVAPRKLVPGSSYYKFDPESNTYAPFVHGKHRKGSRSIAGETEKIVTLPPQNIVVVGGGPTGLITAIHCVENVLISGGIVRLFEARDAFAKGGSSYERAQIVRLDARFTAMMRYHLGTGFEDVFIPASGETDSQLGNTLPRQGFIEITIKDLENLLHTEVSRLWSKGLLSVFADSKARFDSASHALVKLGKHLKEGDLVRLPINAIGLPSSEQLTWKVDHLIYSQPLGLDDLQIDNDYGVYVRHEKSVLPFKLIDVCLESRTYTFKSLAEGVANLKVSALNLPSIYLKDTQSHADVYAVAFECQKTSVSRSNLRQELLMRDISEQTFTLDVGDCHVIEAIGKPHDSTTHLRVTTPEPYGVLCMQGLKVSMGMHNFGEKRWGSGLLDDFRSQNDQNTRIIGDFTKMVRLIPITQKMHEVIATDEDWRACFSDILGSSGLYYEHQFSTILAKLERASKWQAEKSFQFRRQTLQCRFFETGDQFYLGMELPREYEDWKRKIADHICSLAQRDEASNKEDRLKGLLKHHLDRLWYESCLETIRSGDVYNPGARKRVPRLYLINSYKDTFLGDLPVSESFRMCENADDRFEILIKKSSEIIVRNVHGLISRLSSTTLVRREGNLNRTPDGNAESRIAIAMFPVSHYVNYRTIRINESHKDYIFAFIGDEQATPHFMRYSGLTGAGINAMLVNNFIGQAIEGLPFMERFASYSNRTQWSSCEVVIRGTGAGFGEDGFLRPGFSYNDLIDYLYARVVEHREGQQKPGKVLSDDWLSKLAASIVPRGLEMNSDFLLILKIHFRFAIFKKVFGKVEFSPAITKDTMKWAARHAVDFRSDINMDMTKWERILEEAQLGQEAKRNMGETHIPLAQCLEVICNQIIENASKGYVYNERISSQLFVQPKPVDCIVDDFAVEAQNFANSLVLSVALSSAVLTFRLVGSNAFNILSALVSLVNIFISFDTMTNVARYKIRNEEARILYFEKKFPNLKKAIIGLVPHKAQKTSPGDERPIVVELDCLVSQFQKSAIYYGYKQSAKLKRGWQRLKSHIGSRKEIRKFQRMLLCELIADAYHENSYLQEDLVRIYKSLEDVLANLKTKIDKKLDKEEASDIFNLLTKFSGKLDSSLQRGGIKWGFIKRRKLAHWNIVVVMRFFYSCMCRCLGLSGRFAPIESLTIHVLKQVRKLAFKCDVTVLRREVRDLEELYWATHESDIASMIFVSTFLSFVASIVFTMARLFRIQLLEQAAFWATIPSTFGALLAIFHFHRKLCILVDLWRVLRRKAKSTRKGEDPKGIYLVCSLTLTQLFLTFLRLCAATTASVALPFSIAESGFGTLIDSPSILPFLIALVALAQAVLATFLFFVVEYVLRYNLNPTFPAIIVESFRNEVNTLYWQFHKAWNDVETKQVQERATWEYLAREFLHIYRFDTVFAADRFGAILQYLQCGMETEERPYDGVKASKDVEDSQRTRG